MKKLFLSLTALFLCVSTSFAAAVTKPADIPAYYSEANGKSGDALWDQVSSITKKGFTTVNYKNLYTAYLKTDVYPADSVGRSGQIWDMYAECNFSPKKTCGNYDKPCDCYNREHSIPQSWFGGGTSNIGCDIFHVLPTDGKINGVRSNFEYGMISQVKDPDPRKYNDYNDNKLGYAASWSTDAKTIATAAGEEVQGSGTVFQPNPQYRGDLARGIMGAMIKWQTNLSTGNSFFNSVYNASNYYGLTKKAVVLLMKWHREDPVSRKEVDRNNGIQETQGNRNPFIDYPYLAEYIWGERAGERVDMSMLMPSTDPEFVLGQSNGWRGEIVPPEPPTPTVKYGVTWSVNGEEIQVDSVPENQNMTETPAEPTSCSSESTIFVGWTDAPISGIAEEAPVVLFMQANQFPAVTEDITYYAVFAKALTEESEDAETSELIDFNAQGFGNGAAVTKVDQNGVTVTFDKGNGSNEPKYYTSGSAVRCYGGNTMTVAANNITQIDLTLASGGGSNTITTNVGKYEEPTWTGSADEVVFSIGGSNGHRRIASLNVTMNGTASITTYTRFITSCQTAEEVETVLSDSPARKVLIGGRIFIVVGEQMFTTTGQRIK